MATKLVTKESMITALTDPRPEFVTAYIGKALVAIFNNQTDDEKTINSVSRNNNIGFSSSDARSASITAKYYLKNKTLLDWMIDNWTRDFRGAPRITKYHRQLNDIATAKAAKTIVDSKKPTATYVHDQEVEASHIFLGNTADKRDAYFSSKHQEIVIRFGDEPQEYIAIDLRTARTTERFQEVVNMVNRIL